MSGLARLANGSQSRLSNVAKRLEERGWLRREPDPRDGRSTGARLTDSGWEMVRAAAPGHVEALSPTASSGAWKRPARPATSRCGLQRGRTGLR